MDLMNPCCSVAPSPGREGDQRSGFPVLLEAEGAGPLGLWEAAGKPAACSLFAAANQVRDSSERPNPLFTDLIIFRGAEPVWAWGHACSAPIEQRPILLRSTPLVGPILPAGWRLNVSVEQWKI